MDAGLSMVMNFHINNEDRMDFLTTKEAATIIGVSQKMVQSLIRRGRLPAQKIGRDWMIRREDVENHERGKGGRPRRNSE